MFDIKVCNLCGFSEHLTFREIHRANAFETDYRVDCSHCGWMKTFKALPMDYISHNYDRVHRTW